MGSGLIMLCILFERQGFGKATLISVTDHVIGIDQSITTVAALYSKGAVFLSILHGRGVRFNSSVQGSRV